jgi:hypothetical protein
MTFRSNRWQPTPPFKTFLAVVAVAVLLSLLSGCSLMERLSNPQPTFDPRVILPPGQILEVSVSTHRLRKSPSQKIEDFRCSTGPMMCSGTNVTMDCHCPQR